MTGAFMQILSNKQVEIVSGGYNDNYYEQREYDKDTQVGSVLASAVGVGLGLYFPQSKILKGVAAIGGGVAGYILGYPLGAIHYHSSKRFYAIIDAWFRPADNIIEG